MKYVKLFENFEINEGVKWDVDVNEPFSEKSEKKYTKSKITISKVIEVIKVYGEISEDYTEIEILFSNGESIYYEYSGSTKRCVIDKNDDREPVIVTDALDSFLGSTGTVTGDIILIYRNHILTD